jgi:hypothetical protein
LSEERFKLRQKTEPKIGDCVVLGVLICRNVTKRNRIVCRPLQLARRELPGRITIKQQRYHLLGLIGCRTSAGISRANRFQVELRHHVDDKARQMILGDPLLDARGHQKQRIAIERFKMIRYRSSITDRMPKSPTGS